jgi:electron transfer flavoprotein alpha subunit
MICVFVEHDQTRLDVLSLQALTYGSRLATAVGSPLHAIMIGDNSTGLQEQLSRYGVAQLHLVQHPKLGEYAPEAWAKSLVQLLKAIKPLVLLAASTDRGNEILGWVAAMIGLPMASNCLRLDDVSFDVTRFRWGGSLLEESRLHGTPKLVTIAPFVVEAEEIEVPSVTRSEIFSPTLDDKDFRVRVVARQQSNLTGITLQTAPVVIGGGRGVGSKEGFQILEELANLLGGAVGGSRVATNNGWRPHSQQIGLTGNRIAPELYVACGISGAIQHLVGCKGSKRILVINKDRDAPFFRHADYGVVGDLHDILPPLIAEIRKRRSQASRA